MTKDSGDFKLNCTIKVTPGQESAIAINKGNGNGGASGDGGAYNARKISGSENGGASGDGGSYNALDINRSKSNG